MNGGRWTVDSGWWTMDGTVDSGWRTVDSGRWIGTVDSGRTSNQLIEEGGVWTKDSGQLIVDGGGRRWTMGGCMNERKIRTSHISAIGFCIK